MADIKYDFAARDYIGLGEYATRVADATTGNADFPVTATRLTDLQVKRQLLANLVKARDAHEQAGKQLTQQLLTAEKELREELRAVGSFAHGEVRGDMTKLTSGGWDVVNAQAKPQGTLPAPTNLAITYGDEFRELDFMFDPVKGARAYKLQQRVQGTEAWQPLDTPRGTRFSLPDRPVGALEFRVCAVGTAGDGEWSQIISKKLG